MANKNNLPVVAAIPNYNMGGDLELFLPTLLEQGYSDIYVLDDASTDDSQAVVERVDAGIRFIPKKENGGAGSARNQIIKYVGAGAIIHFMDADSVLETENTAAVANDILPQSPFGFVCGLSKDAQGMQRVWNYGPRMGLRAEIGAYLQTKINPLLRSDPDKARAIRSRFANILEDWPDPLNQPERRRVFWGAENNLLFQSDIFNEMGGFDTSLREHEMQELGLRLSYRGLKSIFDPSISVRHTAAQVRGYNRRNAKLAAELAIIRKHSLKDWIFKYDDLSGEV